MSYITDTLALMVLVLFSLVGFAAIFFTTFGTFIIMIGVLIYALVTKFNILTIKDLIILIALYLCGEVCEYIFIIIGSKKFGASNKAIVGALIGAIFGAALGTTLFGIGIVPGTFLGIFLGAFLVELVSKKSFIRSFKAGTGGVLGRVGSIIAKVVIAFIMFTIIGWKVLSQLSF
jgi:uncharacterized protein YqgC (DUF456 family)